MAIVNLHLEDQATKSLSQIASRQIPFIAAKSLTNVAQKSQTEVKKHISDEFHIRKKSGGFESSIRIKPANKKNLTSEVYTMAAFASLQQTGGKKKARDGRLAIPIYDNISDVKRRTARNSPSAYLAGDAFKMRVGSGNEVIARRKGRNLNILYLLKKYAIIDKRLDMVEVSQKVVKDEFEEVFRRNLNHKLS